LTDPVIAARGLRVSLGGQAVLRGVDLEARAGEVVGVLGPSGAGKSTLFRALVGEAPPEAGAVLFDGIDVTAEPLWRRARRGMGYVPQGPSVLWELSVEENLEAFARIARRDGDARKARGPAEWRRSAARVGLEGKLAVRAGDLSGGERRRLELARAITRAPKILVCDEPFAGVDPLGAADLGRLLAEVAREGAAVLLADHHVAEALEVCTRALLLLDGVVAASAPASEFANHPLVRDRYLGTLAV
jgi:lipopolysaccharide export system ATP-binding protein